MAQHMCRIRGLTFLVSDFFGTMKYNTDYNVPTILGFFSS